MDTYVNGTAKRVQELLFGLSRLGPGPDSRQPWFPALANRTTPQDPTMTFILPTAEVTPAPPDGATFHPASFAYGATATLLLRLTYEWGK